MFPYYRRGQGAPIPLRIVEDDDPGSRWKIEASEELGTPFNPRVAPLARAVLVQGERRAAFILVAHQAVADGMSLAFVIRDTLQAIAGATLEELSVPSSQDEILENMQVRTKTSATTQSLPRLGMSQPFGRATKRDLKCKDSVFRKPLPGS